jgi:Tfp pilus assembly protein PilV
MEMMIRQRMRSSGKKAAAKTGEPPVSLSATLTAEWPLSAASADDMLIACQTLTTKIRAADLAGAKEAQATASAEDQETAEESAGSSSSSFEEQGQTPPGEPRFVYVAKISEEDENKALADAFAQAKAQAVRLSRTAGAELGALSSISGNLATNIPDEDYAYAANAMYQDRYQMAMQRQAMMMAASRGPREASGTEPGTLVHPINVMATFNLK